MSNSISTTMDSTNTKDEVVTDIASVFKVYKDGRIERFYETYGVFYVPPSDDDPDTGVSSKDVTISPCLSARLYLPKEFNSLSENTELKKEFSEHRELQEDHKKPESLPQNIELNKELIMSEHRQLQGADQKLPILVYYHGGGLIIGSAFFNWDHRYLNILVSESNSIAISVDYKLAPENDVPSLYQDCWTALQWVASHADKNTTINYRDQWLTDHGDFNRVFLAGDSAGGNIVFNMVMRAGRESLIGDVKLLGSILAFPYFLTPIENIEQTIPYKIWECICPPTEPGIDSPMINPIAEQSPCLSGLGCSRIFMCIGEKDELVPREIGIQVVEAVKKSGWKGELEFIEVEGGTHCFQMVGPQTEKAKDLIQRMASFIQRK